jgi:hypothetical protein
VLCLGPCLHIRPYRRRRESQSRRLLSFRETLAAGSEWFKEIQSALANSKVAVLLVTAHFLTSDFIHKEELGPLLKAAEKGGVRILWVPVRASSYKKTALKDYQAVLDPDKPLSNMKGPERDQAWVRICERIEKAVNSPGEFLEPPHEPAPTPGKSVDRS